MGNSTEFTGTFALSPTLTMAQYAELSELSGEIITTNTGLRGYCQWEPTPKGNALRWDGGEKFYDYTQWLQWLIDTKFKPWGITVSGSVRYIGDYHDEIGTLTVVDGVVQNVPWTVSLTVLQSKAEEMYKLLQQVRNEDRDVARFLEGLEAREDE